MAKVLVVANRTAESDELLKALRKRVEEGDAELHLLVPASPHGLQWATNMDADSGGVEAREHLEAAVERIRGKGVEFDSAVVGDPDPLAAIQDAANLGDYDEIIVSTLPTHLSKWLHLDLPSKARHATGLPVEHVEASEPDGG
jgi:hypothetical protein